jgi:GxxExxY protein
MASDQLGHVVIGAAIEVHRHLGPGLLESTYKECLCYELREAGLDVVVEPYVSISYKTLRIERAFKPDVIVDDRMVLELKHIDKILTIHESQLYTYLQLTGLKTGILLNFNTNVLKNGIRRIDLP